LDENPVVIADTSGIIRFWSPGAEKMFGHAAALAVGRSLELIVPDAHREAHWKGFRRAMASGTAEAEGQVGEFPVKLSDGQIASAMGRLTLVRQMQGKVIAAMVVFQ
jgi:PAS domain S-box-containing protein